MAVSFDTCSATLADESFVCLPSSSPVTTELFPAALSTPSSLGNIDAGVSHGESNESASSAFSVATTLSCGTPSATSLSGATGALLASSFLPSSICVLTRSSALLSTLSSSTAEFFFSREDILLASSS